MSHDVFISYSRKDKTVADAVCATLEQNKIRCWIAPRDILPGKIWSEAIVDAIQTSRVMVLILSSNSNNSPDVIREIRLAVDQGVAILPFRIEDVIPNKEMKYFIGTHHWLDALTPPLGLHLERLSDSVASLLNTDLGRRPPISRPAGVPQSPKRQISLFRRIVKRGRFLLILALAIFLVLTLSRPFWSSIKQGQNAGTPNKVKTNVPSDVTDRSSRTAQPVSSVSSGDKKPQPVPGKTPDPSTKKRKDFRSDTPKAPARKEKKAFPPQENIYKYYFKARLPEGAKTRYGGMADLETLNLSPDGSLLACGCSLGIVTIWDTETAKLRGYFQAHEDEVEYVLFSSDGSRLITTAGNGEIKIWDTRDGTPIATLDKNGYFFGWSARRIALSPDGSKIIIGYEDTSVKIWNTEDGSIDQVMMEHNDEVTAAAWSPVLPEAVTGGDDGQVILWNTLTGKALKHYDVIKEEISSLSFSLDGKKVFALSDDFVKILNKETGDLEKDLPLKGYFSDALISSIGNYPILKIEDDDGDATILNMANGEQALDFPFVILPQGDLFFIDEVRDAILVSTSNGEELACYHFCHKAELSKNGKWLLVSKETGTSLIDISTRRTIRRWKEKNFMRRIGFAAEGRRILIDKGKEGYVLQDTESGAEIATIPKGRGAEIGNSQLLVFDDNNDTTAYELEHGKQLWSKKNDETSDQANPSPDNVITKIHSKSEISFEKNVVDMSWKYSRYNRVQKNPEFSSSGNRALVTGKNMIRLMDVETSSVVRIYARNNTPCPGHFTYDGRELYAFGEKGIMFWDAATGERREKGYDHSDVAFFISSRDGRMAATVSKDGRVMIWDADSKQLISTVNEPSDEFELMSFYPESHCEFSPDGKILYLAHENGAFLAKVDDGSVIWKFPKVNQSISPRASFDSSGKYFAISGFTVLRSVVLRISKGGLDPLAGVPWKCDKLVISKNGNLIAGVHYNGYITLYDPASGKAKNYILSYGFAVKQSAISPDGKWIVNVFRGMFSMVNRKGKSSIKSGLELKHPDRISNVCFSPDSKSLLVGWDRGNADLYDIVSGDRIVRVVTERRIRHLGFSAGGDRFITSSSSGIRVWNAGTGGQIWKLDGSADAAAISPDGTIVVTGHAGGIISLFDIPSGQLLRSIRGGEERISSLRFSRDGTVLIGTFPYKKITLWAVDSGEEIHSITKDIFSADDAMLLKDNATVVYLAGKLYFRRIGEEKPFRVLKATSGSIRRFTMTEDEKTILTDISSGTNVLWELPE